MLDWLMWLSMPKVNAEWEKPGGGTDNLESWMESEFNYRESRAAVYNITFEIFLFFFYRSAIRSKYNCMQSSIYSVRLT